jgi:hypothetical protein
MSIQKKISELTAKTGVLEDSDLIVISDYNGINYDTKSVTGSQIKPYKTYFANISQVGTAAPTVNFSYLSELNSTITFTRVSTGTYELTLSTSELTANKTFVQITNGGSSVNVVVGAVVTSTTKIVFYTSNSTTGVLLDSALNGTQLEIKIIK